MKCKTQNLTIKKGEKLCYNQRVKSVISMENKKNGNFKQNLLKTGAIIALTATILSNITGCNGRLQSITPSYDQPQTPSTTITETYSGNNQTYGGVGQSNNAYFYQEYASLNQVVGINDMYFTPSRSNDNADRRITQGEYENMIMSVTGADYNEFVSLVDNTNVVYKYAEYYQVDEALAQQERYESQRDSQPAEYTELICPITEIPSKDLLIQIINKNSSSYLNSHKGYTPMSSSEINLIAEILYHMIEVNYDSFNETDLRRIYSLLNDIKVVGIDSTDYTVNELRKPYNARVVEDGTIMIDLKTIETYLVGENAKEKTYEHEIYHLFQRMCPDAQIAGYYQIGPSQYWDNLEVNSLHWNWLYESAAEKFSMDHYETMDPLVYKNMVGYLKSLDLITLISPNYEQSAVEESTLVVDEDNIFKLLGAKTPEEKREVIYLLYSIDYLQNNREDFEAVYMADNGLEKMEDSTRTTIKREMKNSICITLTKIFYRNLAERVKNTDVSIQDIFYLINVFEEDINYHTQYDEKGKDYVRMMEEYTNIQNNFFRMLAGNDEKTYNEIVEAFNVYSMAIVTNDGLRRNCELSWLTEEEREFIYDQMVTYNIQYMTTNIRNTK